MTQQYIWIQDKKNNWNKWIIYDETNSSYKIYAECDKRFITEVYKCITHYINGELHSAEVKNPFDTMPERYCKTEFGEFWLKKGEY